MRPRLRAALLWGAVGALSFLVLAQGYRLFRGTGPDLPALLAVAVLVGLAATGLAAAADRVLAKRRV